MFRRKKKVVQSGYCPSCGSEKIRRYAYGYVLFPDEEERQKFHKHFLLGGCIVSDKSPRFHCDACGTDYT
jgi:predicted RNA-binding Zn-ribbon protein involved in translation (DUF1610 family)